MRQFTKFGIQTRRDFFKSIAMAGSILAIGAPPLLSKQEKNNTVIPSEFEYKFKTVSVEHIKEMGRWFKKLSESGKISSNEIFRGYIGNFIFEPEEILPGAKSIIILAQKLQIASIRFHKDGNAYDILIPTDYWDDGTTFEGIKERVMIDLVKDRSKKLEVRVKLPLKTIAVRSGLAKHGRNNITYVDGFGSFHRLTGFYTDMEFEDNWGPLDMLHFCKGCNLCYNNCPTKAITKENFVIDVDKCVTLYNERQEPFPGKIDPAAHNALVGCLKCQWNCPANDEGITKIEKLGELNEQETNFVLTQGKDKKLHKAIITKLARFPYASDLPYFSRNLNAVIKNSKPLQAG